MAKAEGESNRPVDGREGLILFFRVGDQVFGVRLTEVARIEYVEPYSSFAPEMVVADCELPRGGEIRIVNLNKFFGIAPSGSYELLQALIIFGEGDELFGFIADEVENILPAGQTPEVSFPRLLENVGERLYGGFFIRGKKIVPAFNPRQAALAAGVTKRDASLEAGS